MRGDLATFFAKNAAFDNGDGSHIALRNKSL